MFSHVQPFDIGTQQCHLQSSCYTVKLQNGNCKTPHNVLSMLVICDGLRSQMSLAALTAFLLGIILNPLLQELSKWRGMYECFSTLKVKKWDPEMLSKLP